MKLDSSIESLDATSSFLHTLDFTHPRAFQNTLLTRVSITSIIRDAEPHESTLFTATAQRKSAVPDSGAARVLRDRETSVEALLEAVAKVNALYPVGVEAVEGRVGVLKHTHTRLLDSIAGLEREVEEQRARLDLLSSGRDGRYGEDMREEDEDDDEAATRPAKPATLVTEDMIRDEEMEILRLEQLIEAKSGRRS